MALQLETVTAAGQTVRIPIGPGKFRINARAGESYRLIETTGKIPPGTIVRKLDATLVLELESGQVIEIGNFFDVCRPGTGCGFALDTLGAPDGATLDGGSREIAPLSDGSFLMYSQDGAVPAPPPAAALTNPIDWKMVAAAGGGALLLGAAAAGGGGGGGGGGSTGVTAPTTPTISTPAATKDATPVLSGKADAGTRVRVALDTNGNGSTSDATDAIFLVTAAADGSWSVDTGTVPPSAGSMPAAGLAVGGTFAVSVTSINAAGISSPAAGASIVIDQTPPAAPTVAPVGGDNIVGAAERAAGIQVTGQSEAGATIAVTWGNGPAAQTRTGVADSTGAWSVRFEPTAVPADGSTTLTARATDVAGNEGPASAPRTVLVDTTPPLAPTIASGPAGVTNDRTPVISGGAEANTSITVDIDSNRDGTTDLRYRTTASASGQWSVDTGADTPVIGTRPVDGFADGSTIGVRVTAADAAGNSTLTAATLAIDTTVPLGPTLTLPIAGDNALNAAEHAAAVTVAGTVPEAARPVTVTWGAKTVAATVSGTAWTAVFAPADLPAADGPSTVSATYVNAAGTTSQATTQNVTIDTARPTVQITDPVAGTATAPVTFTFSFSEPVTDFTQADIRVSAGVGVSGFQAVSPSVYTAVLAPPASGSGTFTVDVSADSARDGVGNGNVAAPQATQAYEPADTTAPSITSITDNVAAAVAGPGEIRFTFTTSEVVTGFDGSDVNVTGGSITTPFSGSGTSYSIGVTPTANTQSGTAGVSVGAGAFTDATGNANTAPASASQAYDTLAPTLTSIQDPVSGTARGPVTFTFNWSEAVSGFALADIVRNGGGSGTFGALAGSGSTYTLQYTPVAGESGTLTLDVAAGVVTDAAGNASSAGGSASQDYDVPALDTTPPTVTVTPPAGTGNAGAMTFTLTTSETATLANAAAITATGGTISTAPGGSGTSFTVGVTPNPGVQAGTVTVNVAAGAFEDAAGNGSTAASGSRAYDSAAPTLLSIEDGEPGTANGPVTFTFTWSENVTGFDIGDITVSNAGSGTVGALAGSGSAYTLTFTPAAGEAGTLGLSVGPGAATDAVGNTSTGTQNHSQPYAPPIEPLLLQPPGSYGIA